MESIIKGFLNERYHFIRFYPEEIAKQEPAVYMTPKGYFTSEEFVEQSQENIVKFIENFNRLKKFDFSSTNLKALANDIIFENRTLKESLSKKALENYIKDIIVNSLSIKIGFSLLFEELFALGRTSILGIVPKKVSLRIPCDAEIGDVVFVCVNNEKPYVSSPGIVVQKAVDDYVIFYFTNLLGGKESQRIKINDFSFQTFNSRTFGKTRIQSIENRKNN